MSTHTRRPGWFCPGCPRHVGPCHLIPRWWNLRGWLVGR